MLRGLYSLLELDACSHPLAARGAEIVLREGSVSGTLGKNITPPLTYYCIATRMCMMYPDLPPPPYKRFKEISRSCKDVPLGSRCRRSRHCPADSECRGGRCRHRRLVLCREDRNCGAGGRDECVYGPDGLNRVCRRPDCKKDEDCRCDIVSNNIAYRETTTFHLPLEKIGNASGRGGRVAAAFLPAPAAARTRTATCASPAWSWARRRPGPRATGRGGNAGRAGTAGRAGSASGPSMATHRGRRGATR